ncbi:MAG TPA: hypothetical protein VJ302_27725, partial [Blastocatellia bacterium]|nr:hypothetical protein [Blastocatellia bacterium]
GEEKKRARDEINQRLASLGDIEAQLAEAEAALKALADPRTRAHALSQSIAREEEWRRESESAERRVVETGTAVEARSLELKVFASLDSEIASVIQVRAQSERDYQAFIANEKLAVTVATREQEVVNLSTELEETEKALSASLELLSGIEGQYDVERHRRAQFEMDQCRERSAQVATQLEHAREQFQRLQAQLAYLNQVREKAREQIAEKEQAARLREVADFIRDTLQKAAPYITESYLFSISGEANQLFREITGRHDVTLRWTREYEITLEEEGRERPFLNLSGGEQMAAALSVRLALLKELSEINLAFFDEPTTNMDEERRRNLAQQIGRIKDFQQLFVISHDDSFEGYTDQTISLAERN